MRTPEPVADAGEVSPPAPAPSPTQTLVAPDPQALRAMLSHQPDLIETGLEVLLDDAGNPVGASYATDVGDIDLLARDADGGLVVVLVSDASTGDALVAEALQRVGWVRKHLGNDGEKVRGIVLVASQPDNLSYAAAAVADTVSFKTWRVALTFSDLEV